MSGGIIAHADGITFGQPLGDTMVLVKALALIMSK